MLPKVDNGILYRQRQSEITKKNWQLGLYNSLRKPLNRRSCQNPECPISFFTKDSDPKKYCSSHCAAIVNNSKRIRNFSYCLICNRKTKRHGYRYCSLQCLRKDHYHKYIAKWLNGETNGDIGVNTKGVSSHIKRYLRNKFEDKCTLCDWNEVNPITGKVPLEVDHIDGNSSNNTEPNLRLICPNCHALTANFRGLNKGKGRPWRMAKYIRSN